LTRASIRTLQVVVYAMLFSAVLFFGLTRTEVGRDGLRQQLETQFNSRFAGTLQIGALRGDLVNTLYASNVQLLDPQGRVVTSIDSLIASPRWTSLLGGTVSIRSLRLIRPHLALHRAADGAWNAQAALRRLQPSPDDERAVDWTLTDITVQEGSVGTMNHGEDPPWVQKQWLFNYADAEVQDLNARATLEWNAQERLVEVYEVSMRLPDPRLTVTSLQAQVVQDAGTWTLNQLALDTDGSRIRGSGSLAHLTDSSPPELDLDLARSQLDHDELRWLVPRLPLAGSSALEGHIHGDLSRLVVETFEVAHGNSRVRLSGTVFGLPDSADVEARLQDTRLHVDDLRTVWPSADLSRIAPLQRVMLDGFAKGVLAWEGLDRPAFTVQSTLTAASPVGAVAGSLNVTRSPGTPVRYDASLQTDSLDPGTLLRRPALASRLNGRVQVQGRGVRRDSSLQTQVAVQLRPSIVAGQRMDSLSFAADVTGRRLQGTLDLTQRHGGRLRGRATVDAGPATPRYEVAITGTDVDLGRGRNSWQAGLPTTRLNGVVTVDGRGTTWEELAGTLSIQVDTSRIVRGDSTTFLPPHWSTFEIAEPGRARPRLRAFGSVGTLEISGDVSPPALIDLGRLWSSAVGEAVRREIQKPYPRGATTSLETSSVGPTSSPEEAAGAAGASPLLASTDPANPSLVRGAAHPESMGRPDRNSGSPQADWTRLRTKARASLQAAGLEKPLRVQALATLQQPEILSAWWQAAPQLAPGTRMETTVQASADSMSTEGRLTAPAVRKGGSSVDGLAVTLRSSASLDSSLASTLKTRVDVQADTVRAAGQTVTAPSLSAEYGQHRGVLQVTAGTDSAGSPFRMTAGLYVLEDRNVVVIQDLYAQTPTSTWQNSAPGRIDLYADAAVIDSFTVSSPRPRGSGTQNVQAYGTLSSAAQDTVFVDASDVLLHPLFQLTGASRAFGGLLQGQVAVTGGVEAPTVTSRLSVERLSFDRRLLGNLQISARRNARSEAVEVNATIRPELRPLDTLRAEEVALVPQGLRTAEANDLRLGGHVRFPSLLDADAPPTSDEEPQLDLQFQVDRADLFFFEYIFEDDLANVQGYTAGTGRITGSFVDPTFDADMEVRDGRFQLPQFGLTYQLDGTVKVDREGFHLRDVTVSDTDGRAVIEGGVLFNDYRYFSFDLQGDLDEIKIIDVSQSEDLPFYGTIRASGQASLTGPLSDARLVSEAARTTPDSELFIPVSEAEVDADSGFFIFADSTGRLPDIRDLTQRDNIFSDRPAGEPTFIDGLEIDVNVIAPEGSTVNLVFDPLVGDVVTAVGSGRVQLQQQEGEFLVYGQFNVSGGDYLFTAGEVFVRRFTIGDGTLTWDGDPINAKLDLDAAYRTRASTRGLPGARESSGRIPVLINLDITGRVETPQVNLSLALARDERGQLVGTRTLDAILNQPDAATEYATSVLLTNTFLLTTSTSTQGAGDTDGGDSRLASAGNQLAFNSVSQLVASQLNRYLSEALPNVDINFGLQGEDPADLDVIYGVALRLLDERLIIRGEGVYTGDETDDPQTSTNLGPQGEFVVEVRLSNRVSAEVFFRRQGDDIAREALTQTAGVGISYQSEFSTWRQLYYRLFGWLGAGPDRPTAPPDTTDPTIATRPDEEVNDSSGGNDDP